MSKPMRLVCSLVLPMFLLFAPVPAAAQEGSIAGVATNSNAQPVGNAVVQLVDANGKVLGTGTTNAAGEYIFTGVPAGTYTVQIVNEKNEVVGTTAPFTLAAGQALTGISITLAVVTAAAAGGGSMLAILLALIGAGGVAGAIALGVTSSPSS